MTVVIEYRDCGCETVTDGDATLSVQTCPVCLPAGAITWLTENGRQLDLLEERGVGTDMRGLEAIEKSAQDHRNGLRPRSAEGLLPF